MVLVERTIGKIDHVLDARGLHLEPRLLHVLGDLLIAPDGEFGAQELSLFSSNVLLS